MNEKLTLSELQLLIRDALYLSLPQMFWVTAEISEISVNTSGHCYLELIEKQQDEKNIRAKVRGIIWNSRFSFVSSFFENITGETLKPGLKVLVRAKIEYHEIYGLSIVITDIDPAFTLGEMALKRLQIIKKLEDEGVFSMNRDLGFPLLPQRIAVVSSKNAAGYKDFINHLAGNSYGYVFYIALIDTPMQGTETEQGIINSLDRIANNAEKFDLVVIIRGGGSKTDLSWFDSYGIAYHITQFPLPVITGIGHEKDLSVTDMVANKSLRTPTAVADYLVDCMADAENKLIVLSTEIRDTTREIIDQKRSEIDTYNIKIQPLARIMLAENRELLSGKILELTSAWKNQSYRYGMMTAGLSLQIKASAGKTLSERIQLIDACKKSLQIIVRNSVTFNGSRLENLKNNLKFLDPDNVLRRGFTITSVEGMIIKSCKQLSRDDKLQTLFSDGKAESRIISIKERESR